MATKKSEAQALLNVIFLPSSFIVEPSHHVVDETITDWVNRFETDKYQALFHLGFEKRALWFSPALDFLHQLAELLIKKLSQSPDLELNRENTQLSLLDEECHFLMETMPFALGMEYVDNDWVRVLWDALLGVFCKEIQSYEGSVAHYFAQFSANINVVGKVFFHLVESKDTEFPFAFMATYSMKPVKSKRAVHTPLKHALEEFEGDESRLLTLISTVIKAAEKSQLLSDLLESGELFSPIKLTVDEAYIFLKEMPHYEEAGVMCRIPDWWRKKNKALRLSVSVGEKAPSQLGLEALMDFRPKLTFGGQDLSEGELRALLELSEGLVNYKGNWVEVNPTQLETALKAFEKAKAFAQEDGVTLGEAMRFELTMKQSFGDLALEANDDLEVSITNGQWLKALTDRLVNPSVLDKVAIPPTFQATLRSYQETGYQWLNQMHEVGFGACLADDMGLGKTVQIIAFLDHQRTLHGGRQKALLVLPASLIGNWQKEVERFAPGLPYQIMHKSELKSSEPLTVSDDAFLYITTYGMAVKLEALKVRVWDYLILDEAQAIKNPGTKQTKAIKSIQARTKIALTGTPIENKLGDLWSLFDFLNAGLLGTPKEFTQFTKGLAENAHGYVKLRKMIQPFILRRLKTDKRIISDLPDKLEINAYTLLSKKQIVLYQGLIKELSNQLLTAEGIARKGLVLASIMKFKQICNHPDQYLGREDYKEEHSGKFEQLREICETIHDKRERVLVFTQFREMTEPIAEFLKGVFDQEGLVLHGGTPIKRRSEMVEQFNGEHYVPFMVLSLKAGGVGLNLTAANHVIHFDRWWNPAVENQATDRAFRIGQSKHVLVHKFVTKGTIEEKIDAIIAQKQQLSGDILSATGEQWLSEYSNDDLMKLIALEGDFS